MPGGKHENTQPWSPEEDQVILEMHALEGPKWSKIVQQLPNRSVSSIRNRFEWRLAYLRCFKNVWSVCQVMRCEKCQVSIRNDVLVLLPLKSALKHMHCLLFRD
eukprot:6200678-Pleurochrysis_carterae.AAC.2